MMGDSTKRARTEAGASKVLHIRALPDYVSEGELMQLCAPFGAVHKVLIIADKHQAFVQMDNQTSAASVIAAYAVAPAMVRAKTVYIQFSSRQEVEVKQHSGPTGGGPDTPGCVLLVSVLNAAVPVTLENIHQIFQPHGDVLKIITFNKGTTLQALVQMASVESANNAKMYLEGKDMFQGCCHLRIAFSQRQQLIVKENSYKSRDYTQGVAGGPGGPPAMLMYGAGGAGSPNLMGGAGANLMGANLMGPGPMGDQGSGVVLVNKLTPEKCNPAVLFKLFGVYGDVLRVKILFNKRDTAMIQFATSQQAKNACANLNGCPLFGEELSVAPSRYTEVKLPRSDDSKDVALTQDFTGSASHRFKNKSFINQKNVNAPSQVLHIANIHDSVTEADLSAAFGACQQPGATAPVVEFFKSSHKMAYICMASVSDAVMALIGMHDEVVGTGGYPVRVSFSHKSPESILQNAAEAADTM